MYTLIYDFEGTFKNPSGLSKEAIKILNKFLKNKENKILIVSDSTLDELLHYLKDYNLDIELYSVSSLSFYKNKNVEYNLITKDIITYINDLYKDDIYTAYGEGITASYIYSYQNRLDAIYPKKRKMKLADLSYYIIAINKDKKLEIIKTIKDLNLAYDLLGDDPNRCLIRIKKYGLTKKDVALNYKKESPNNILIGFSDSYHDIDFLNVCNVKVAMKNAKWELTSVCDYITDEDENHDGAIKILNNICKF